MSESDKDVAAISPYVVQVLTRSRFFDLLDHRLCLDHGGLERARCCGDFSIARSLLETMGFPAEDQDDIFAVLEHRGAACDCEILYNVVVESRLKAEYWQSKPGPRRRLSHGA